VIKKIQKSLIIRDKVYQNIGMTHLWILFNIEIIKLKINVSYNW